MTGATVELLSDGTAIYICEASTTSLSIQFMWEVVPFSTGTRESLDPITTSSLYTITNDIESTMTPLSGSSTLTYNRNEVNFEDPNCVVSNGLDGVLRVRTSEFSMLTDTPGKFLYIMMDINLILLIIDPTEATNLTEVVSLPVWGIILIVAVPTLVIMMLLVILVALKCVHMKKKHGKISVAIER